MKKVHIFVATRRETDINLLMSSCLKHSPHVLMSKHIPHVLMSKT